MANLPRIPASKVVEKAAVEAKVFPDKYIVGFNVQRTLNGRQPCRVDLQAYNFDTKEISDDTDTIESFQITDIWEEAGRSQMFAQVMGGLIQTVFLMYQERELRQQITYMVEGADRDAAIAQFQAIQIQLGVEPETIPDPFEETEVWAKPLDVVEPEPEGQ